jgi:CheY-like chemotaxis protein
LGFDAFQGFLGRIFQLLEDLESGAEPWSGRADALLHDAEAAEARFLEGLERGEPQRAVAALGLVEAAIVAWRRIPIHDASETPLAALPQLGREFEAAAQQIARLRQAVENGGLSDAARDGLATLEREIATLQAAVRAPRPAQPQGVETSQEGLRNHCEGALHHLVEAAAQEVLDEARERGLRLALRVTGALDPVDEGLGAALLEILAHLWSDCLEMQAPRGEATIDTVLRAAEQRLVVEVRDGGVDADHWRAVRSDDDVLGCYPGLRRSRPVVESVHGLVQVEPHGLPGCRFRLSLPLSTERPHAALVRVGQHDIAIPAASIDAVYAASEVRIAQDAAGAFVEAEGVRVPVLHLAFLLGDVSFDELRREQVVLVGSFERRAALFASEARRSAVGQLAGDAQGLWAGRLETERGGFPLLHVGALLGRCAPTESALRPTGRGPGVRGDTSGPLRVVVVDSATQEREHLQALLTEAGHRVRAVQNADEAWKALESEPVDLLLCDLRLPEMNAQQIAERRRQSGSHVRVPMVLVLAHAGEQSHLVVQQLGANSWVQSPLVREEILDSVGRHVVQVS